MIFQLCNGNVVFRFKVFDLLVALKRRERREKREKKREKKRRERERERERRKTGESERSCGARGT